MSEISDEIREFIDDEDLYPRYIAKLRRIADRADRELVELPKDAHGEYIRVGGTLDGYGKTIEVVELRYGRSGWVIVSRDGNAYADCAAFSHHYIPTVEDVLREFADEVWNRCCEGATASDSGIDGLVAECAAKLRLTEGEDA